MRPTMKRAVLIIFLMLFSAGAFASEFCDGFNQGYITGYKQASHSSLAPLVPLCPLEPLKGFGDPKSDFEFGYTIGYRKGLADGSR
jgi:hypothetical protein